LKSLGETNIPHSFEVIYALNKKSGTPIPSPLAELKDAEIRFSNSVNKEKESLWKAAKVFIEK